MVEVSGGSFGGVSECLHLRHPYMGMEERSSGSDSSPFGVKFPVKRKAVDDEEDFPLRNIG